MLQLFRNKRAQSTAEYALLITLVISALGIMEIYTKRGLQARVKAGMDNIPGKVMSLVPGGGYTNLLGGTDNASTQFEPTYLGESNITELSKPGTEKMVSSEAGGKRYMSEAKTQRSLYTQTIKKP